MNEQEELVCPTDSRNRPDQRLMEEGEWDEANAEKLRLEEKQRATRRRREAEAELAAAEGDEGEGGRVGRVRKRGNGREGGRVSKGIEVIVRKYNNDDDDYVESFS